jgi:hypothetical protein
MEERKASSIVPDYRLLASKQLGTRSGNDLRVHYEKARMGGSSISTLAATPRNTKRHVVVKRVKLKLGRTCVNVYTEWC